MVFLKKDGLLNITVDNETIGTGEYGTVKVYDDNSLIKIYHNQIPGICTTKQCNIDKLTEKNNKLDEMFKKYDSNYKTKLEELVEKIEKIKKTKSKDLIKDIVVYNDYPIGIIMPNYKDYINLNHIINDLDEKELMIVFEKISELFEDLLKNGIYPTDFDEKNIMINKELDVKIIDLDDKLTKVSGNKENNMYECLNHFEEMANRFFNRDLKVK